MNPELRRNLWLEFSPTRVIMMPLILALVLAIAWMSNSVPSVARTVTGILLILWGTRLAADAVLAEVADRTWDAQRSASLGPLAMTIGKLFGATAFTWYGAALALPFAMMFGGHEDPTTPRLLLIGILAQAVALLSSLIVLRLRPTGMRMPATFAQIIGIGVAILFLTSIPAAALQAINWGGHAFPGPLFTLATLLFAAGWAIAGCWRLMREELQYRNQPLVWIGFVLFWMIYAAGLGVGEAGDGWHMQPAFAVAVVASVLIALAEPKGVGAIRALLLAVYRGRPLDIVATLPGWVWSGLLALLAALAIMVEQADAGRQLTEMLGSATGPTDAALYGSITLPLVILAFALRDVMLIHFVALTGTARSHMACIVYLTVLYAGLPTLLYASEAYSLLPLFLPFAVGPEGLAQTNPALPLAEAALFAGLLVWRYRSLVRGLGDGRIAGTAGARA
ncbi:hypothetical protein [Zavarzinia sp. CC-PAN008]|uniref:hypothetical protein n=1 Tax=Zavarzinia sp. CC-PAN008 TaxID=3243332 RepID=UPI003F74946E